MVDLVNDFLGKLANISAYGDSSGPLPESAKNDIKAVLIGATMALEQYRDRVSKAAKQPREHIQHVSHFLDLVNGRVGFVDQSSGDKQIRMTFDDKQATDKITYRKALVSG